MGVIWIDSGRFGSGGTQPWTPANTTTALWLDAADASTITTVSGAVSQWNDKSGNGRNVFQSGSSSRPAYNASGFNNKGALAFDGSNDLLESVASITTGTYTGEFNVFWVGTRNSNGGTVITERSSALVGSSQWLNLSNVQYISSDGQNASANHTISSTTFNLLTTTGGLVFHRHAPGSRDTLFLNGTQVTVTAGTASNITGGTSYFRVGAREAGNGQFFNGSLCEIIVMLSNPSTDIRQRMEGYLAHKWELTASLPNDHPYKSSAPTA
jgi:hypothetical protein